jgi:hypothetical protein
MDKFNRERLRAALKSGNISVTDGEIRQLDGVFRAIVQRYLARKAARKQDLRRESQQSAIRLSTDTIYTTYTRCSPISGPAVAERQDHGVPLERQKRAALTPAPQRPQVASMARAQKAR